MVLKLIYYDLFSFVPFQCGKEYLIENLEISALILLAGYCISVPMFSVDSNSLIYSFNQNFIKLYFQLRRMFYV